MSTRDHYTDTPHPREDAVRDGRHLMEQPDAPCDDEYPTDEWDHLFGVFNADGWQRGGDE